MSASRIVIVVLAITCAGLGAAAVTSRHHARELEARFQQSFPTTSAISATISPSFKTGSIPGEVGESEDAPALLAENLRLKEQVAALASAQAGLTNFPDAAESSTNRLSYMERVRRDDPDRYKQIMEQREQRRQQAEQWYQNQFAALDERAQTATSKQEVDLVTQIGNALDRVQQLRDSWRAVRDLPEDQRAAAVEQLRTESRDAYATLNALREQDRQFQLQQLATQIGYRDTSSMAQFAEAVQQIYKNTEYTPPRGGGRGMAGGGGVPSSPTPAQP